MIVMIRIVFLCLFLGTLSNAARREALITGGCGFVGRHFTKTLCDMGWKITIVDNMISESALPLNKWPTHLKPTSRCEIVYHEMDCRDFFASRESHYNYDLFVHLAAVVGGRAKIEGSPVAVADDLAIDATAFQWAIDSHNKKMPLHMIYFSSSAAYPIKYQTLNSGILLNETMIDLVDSKVDIAKPDLTYGWAKLTGEYLAKLSHDYYQLNVSIYRPMSGYGEDQHEAYPFKSILLKAMRKDNPIKIWSDAVRDFIHISDIVQCVLGSVDKIGDANPVNLGTGIATSFSHLAKLMAKEMGYEATVEVLSGMPQGVMYRVGDPTRELHLGCKLQTTIEQGIRKAIDFMNTAKKEEEEAMQQAKRSAPPHQLPNGNRPIYSSYHCIGGSQIVSEQYWKHPREFLHFPVYEPEYRTCKVHNLCYINGELTYFQDPFLDKEGLHAFAMSSWEKLFSLGAWSPHPMKLKVSKNEIPENIPFDDAKYHFLDAHSNSYNFGHYILDNVMPHFIAADQFGIDFKNARQIFESSCKKFGSQPERMAHSTVPFNASMGTFRSACLQKLNFMWKYFFDFPPLYLEPLYASNVCFDTVLLGQGSTYGLKTVDASRGGHLRRFRDFVLDRITVSERLPEQENLILVGIRSSGHSGGEQLDDLCSLVQHAVRTLFSSEEVNTDAYYRVQCIVNQDLEFVQEIKAVQAAKILISVHGTISYMSLFARDGTQQIILYDPNENRMKEHNILMYLTHAQPYYYPWTDMKTGFLNVLRLALDARQQYEQQDAYQSHHTTPTDYHSFDSVPTMVPIDGTYIRSAVTGDTIFVMQQGHRYPITTEMVHTIQSKGVPIHSLRNYEMEIIPLGKKE